MVGYTHLEFKRIVWTGDTHLGVLDLKIMFKVLNLGKVIKRISVSREKIPGSEDQRRGELGTRRLKRKSTEVEWKQKNCGELKAKRRKHTREGQMFNGISKCPWKV